MAMQISVDPASLTTEQREAVADFILTYPNGVAAGKVVVDVTADASKLKAAIAEIQDSTAVGAGTIAHEDLPSTGMLSAAEAFTPPHTDPTAAAAFGSAPAPLPQGATAAPSTAAAAPSLTAPAVMPATTSAATLSVPVPPAQNSAPVAQAAALPTGSPAAGVDLDKNGLPWDGRIHSEGKNKIADGSWRKKRGVDPALVATVEAELRAVMTAPAAAYANSDWPFPGFPGNAPAASPAAQAPVAQTAAIPAPPPAAPSAPAVGNVPQAPSAPPAPTSLPASPAALAGASPIPAASVADNGQDPRAMFVALVGRASAAIQGGKVTQAEVNQCCANAGVPALPLLANRLDLVASVAASVDALIASRG